MGMVNMLVLYSGNDIKISRKCITGDVCLSARSVYCNLLHFSNCTLVV
jgi:hypothetical protein